jgi:DNA-binding NarL/FixJ family response regulator
VSKPPLKLLIADDNELFVSALEGLLVNDASVRVVARAPNGEAAAELAAALRPDVVLMDLSMPQMDGFAATEKILADSPGTAWSSSPARTIPPTTSALAPPEQQAT